MYSHVVHIGEAQASGFHPGGSSLCLGSRPGPSLSGRSASRSSCGAIVATITVSGYMSAPFVQNIPATDRAVS